MFPADYTITVPCAILLIVWNFYYFNTPVTFRFSVTRGQFRFWLFIYNIVIFSLWFILWYIIWFATKNVSMEYLLTTIGISDHEVFDIVLDFLRHHGLSTNQISVSGLLSVSLLTFLIPKPLSFFPPWLRQKIQNIASFSSAVNDIADQVTKADQQFDPSDDCRKRLENHLKEHHLDLHDFLDHKSDAHRLWAEIEVLAEALSDIRNNKTKFAFFRKARANTLKELKDTLDQLTTAMLGSFQLANSLWKQELPKNLEKEVERYLAALVGTLKQYRRRIVSLIVEALITQGYSKRDREQFFQALGYTNFEEFRTGLYSAEIAKIALIAVITVFVVTAILAEIFPETFTRLRAITEGVYALTILPSVVWVNVRILFRFNDKFKDFRLGLYFLGAVSAVPITYFWAALWVWLFPELTPHFRTPLWSDSEQMLRIAGMLPFISLLGVGVNVVTDPRGYFSTASLRDWQKRFPERVRSFVPPAVLRCLTVVVFALVGVGFSVWASPLRPELAGFGSREFLFGAGVSAVVLGSFFGWLVPKWSEEEHK